jgi:hypothetical protein
MDKVVADSLRAVSEAEAALAEAEAQLRQAWVERLAALNAAGYVIAYVHEDKAERIGQRLVVTDAEGQATIDLDAMTAGVVA